MRSLILRLIPLLLATALLCGCTPVPDPTDTDLGGTDPDSAVTDSEYFVLISELSDRRNNSSRSCSENFFQSSVVSSFNKLINRNLSFFDFIAPVSAKL